MPDYARGSISGEGMRARGSMGGDGINLRASISGEGGSDGRGKGRRERAMAEAALTLAEIGQSLLLYPCCCLLMYLNRTAARKCRRG